MAMSAAHRGLCDVIAMATPRDVDGAGGSPGREDAASTGLVCGSRNIGRFGDTAKRARGSKRFVG